MVETSQPSLNLSRAEEADLVVQAAEDPVAFGRLYELHVQKIYNYIYYRTGNHRDAEDLTSRVFFKALQHIDRYQERGAPFSAWLYRIAHNMVVNWHRGRRRKEVVALDDVVGRLVAREDPHSMVERAEDQQHLLEAIRQLPAVRQELLILKFVERFSNQEIGEILGRSEGAVKSLYHRTLLSLRKELAAEG